MAHRVPHGCRVQPAPAPHGRRGGPRAPDAAAAPPHPSRNPAPPRPQIGPVKVGSAHKIALQTMTTTDTRDIAKTVEQVKRCADAGADIVRITVQGKKEAEACMLIREQLFKDGCGRGREALGGGGAARERSWKGALPGGGRRRALARSRQHSQQDAPRRRAAPGASSATAQAPGPLPAAFAWPRGRDAPVPGLPGALTTRGRRHRPRFRIPPLPALTRLAAAPSCPLCSLQVRRPARG
jgi:hypothetical protein